MTTLADLRGDCSMIEETYGQARIEWDTNFHTDKCAPVICWEEGMRFHMQRLREYEAFDLNTLPSQVEEHLQELLPDDFNCYVGWSDWADDHEDDADGEDFSYPYLHIDVWPVTAFDWDMDEEDAFNMLWPAIATLFNVTDPGTWNCPYLFSGLALIKTYDEDDED